MTALGQSQCYRFLIVIERGRRFRLAASACLQCLRNTMNLVLLRQEHQVWLPG